MHTILNQKIKSSRELVRLIFAVISSLLAERSLGATRMINFSRSRNGKTRNILQEILLNSKRSYMHSQSKHKQCETIEYLFKTFLPLATVHRSSISLKLRAKKWGRYTFALIKHNSLMAAFIVPFTGKTKLKAFISAVHAFYTELLD